MIKLVTFGKEILIGLFFVLFITFYGFWRYEVLSHKTTKNELKLAGQTIQKHVENIELVERINNDYQGNIDRLNADIKRMRNTPPRCVTVTKPPSVHTKQGQGRGYAQENGISSQWLYDYAYEAEQLRIERNSCKDFINNIYKSME